MATKRQNEANRRNASKSTGPKTLAGKQKSAANSERHGFTAPPSQTDVANWFRVILGDLDIGPEAAFSDSPEYELALRLAGAEADVARMRARVAQFRSDAVKPYRRENSDFSWHSVSKALNDADEGFRAAYDLVFGDMRSIRTGAKRAATNELRLFERYLKAAENRRTVAFADWIEFQQRTRRFSKRTQMQP